MEQWLKRLLKLIEGRGMTQKSVSLAAKLDASTINTWVKKGAQPSRDNLLKVAQVLGTTPDYIEFGDASQIVRVPVVGIASAGEGWSSPDNLALAPLSFDLDAADAIAIEVRGDSMSPVYRDGDFLVCSRRNSKHIDNLIGVDCVVLTTGGEGFIKILKRGTMRGRHNLKSYNPLFDDIENAELAWVAPIAWIRRGSR